MKTFFLGVVADDFTGASDAASFLEAAGVKTLLLNGVPGEELLGLETAEAVVVALKTRTEPAEQAVKESMEAFRWLKQTGAEQLYFKYCSTFDSTKEGNIGPVIDAVLDGFRIPCTVVCPSLPVNGRTVRNGYLYVNGILLEESPMKDHPLTPMRDSYLPRLLEAQGKYKSKVLALTESPVPQPGTRYLIPDYYEDAHGDQIAGQFGHLPFLTGGSGLAGALGRRYAEKRKQTREEGKREWTGTEGRAVVLAGSCSAMTLKQIRFFQDKGHPSFRIYPEQLADGRQTVETVMRWLDSQKGAALVYSSAAADERTERQEHGCEPAAERIEAFFSGLAARAADAGYRRFIVAGGETSGAVAKGLGCSAFHIGPSVASGVPVMIPCDNTALRLVLKSGNFGQVDFFERAVFMTAQGEDMSVNDLEQIRSQAVGQNVGKELLELFSTRKEEEIQIPGREGEIHVFVYYPHEEKELYPVLINLHGGGFVKGHREQDVVFCRNLCQNTGAMVFDIDYKTAPEHRYPCAVYETYDVMKYLWDHWEKWKLDRSSWIAVGHSAGGNLILGASILAGKTKEFQLAGLICDYPPLDLDTEHSKKRDADRPGVRPPAEHAKKYMEWYIDPQQRRESTASPAFAPEEELQTLPPVLIITAELDALGEEGERFACRLIKAGVPVAARRVMGASHGFVVRRTEGFEKGERMIFGFIREIWRR